MIHKGTVTLETERLILRRFTMDDAEAMYRNWASDPEVTRFLNFQPHADIDVSRACLVEWIEGYDKVYTYRWAIVPKDFGKPIGYICIGRFTLDVCGVFHIDYCIGKRWWGQGYTSEAAKELVRFFFEEVGVNRVESHHDPRNPNSGKVMTNAGLKFEGILRQSDRNNQGVCDAAYYAITADEYFGNRGKTTVLPKSNIDTINDTYTHTRSFIYRNARPLDLARWQYHFEGGSKEAVLTALAAYQNEDGGFGHALEPDMWNPNSSPMQTWTATQILREIVFNDNTHPIIKGILRYLASGKDFEGRVWYNSGQCNNDYPHAPWWHIEGNNASYSNYSTTASLAGFIIRFADKVSEIYKLGYRIAKEAYDAYLGQDLLGDAMTASCYVQLWQYCEEAGTTDIIDLVALKERLCTQVKHSITQNTAIWETDYICKPSQFFNSSDSIFYADNKDITDYECEFIIKSQLEDGSWNIPWGWNGYPEEWAISKNWWKSNGAILNMLYLKGMGRFNT